MIPTRRCIYCLENKPETAFNREHIIPQAFGRFEHNLVLECVCEECNTYFANRLDLKLARDSFEGFERFRRGVKKPKDYKSLGRLTTRRIEITEEGPMKGALCEMVRLDGTLGLKLLPQLGFAISKEGPFEYFQLENVPSNQEMRLRGHPKGTRFWLKFWECSEQLCLEILRSKGYEEGDPAGEVDPPDDRLHCEAAYAITHQQLRAIAKIAFNYLAANGREGIAKMPEFNTIRRYIRDNEIPSAPLVTPVESLSVQDISSETMALGHYVSVQKVGQRVLAQVSLLTTVRYLVVLSEGPFFVPWQIASCHFFNLNAGKAVKVPAPPLPGEQQGR